MVWLRWLRRSLIVILGDQVDLRGHRRSILDDLRSPDGVAGFTMKFDGCAVLHGSSQLGAARLTGATTELEALHAESHREGQQSRQEEPT